MAAPAPIDETGLGDTIQETAALLDQLGAYSSLIVKGASLILIGLLLVFLLQKLVSKALYSRLENPRLIKVGFGALYVMILVVTSLLALSRLGFDTSRLGTIAVLAVLAGSVVAFFLAPYFPRLPFKTGHMVEIDGVMGTIEQISTFHTAVRKFDGTIVFIPNQLILTSPIQNYHESAERRVEMNVSVRLDGELEAAREALLRIMNEDERVLALPAKPVVYATGADAHGTQLTAYCWVMNKDWFPARSDLWFLVVHAFEQEEGISISRPQQDVHICRDEPK
jgi:small conductance mechanosensitive channel